MDAFVLLARCQGLTKKKPLNNLKEIRFISGQSGWQLVHNGKPSRRGRDGQMISFTPLHKRLKSKLGWAGLGFAGMDHHDADQLIDALMGN